MRTNWLQIGAGAALLMAGAAIYALARSTRIWALPEVLHAPHLLSWLGRAADSAPTFAHVAAMALLTAGVLGASRRMAWLVVTVWAAINVAFEAGQHALLRIRLIGFVPEWLERVWLVDRTRQYFLNGTFDVLDIAAALLGGGVALAVILHTAADGQPDSR